MKVLIVEDEMRASRGLRKLLTSISPEADVIAEASDGRIALDLIWQHRPEVVFTDIQMPYMDGISLIKAVQDLRIDTKFVIITAYEEFEFARQAISLGVVEYLVKPVTVEEVTRTWERLQQDKSKGKDSVKKDEWRELYPDAHPLIIRALEMIESSYAAKISQKELSETLGISAEYFSFLFKRDVKENFAKFLRKYRIEKAKQLLDEGKIPSDQICYSVGIADPKYFSKCFKEETGVNVTEYKRMK